MILPDEIGKDEISVLVLISNGHPSRKMTATKNGIPNQVNALTWDEIIVSSKLTLVNLWNCVARLGAHGFTDNGAKYPTLWGRMRGEPNTSFYWATQLGRELVRSLPDSQIYLPNDTKSNVSREVIKAFEDCLKKFGYSATPYGSLVGYYSLISGYSAEETASLVAYTTLALDVSECGDDIINLITQATHGAIIITLLKSYRDKGLFSEKRFKNDAHIVLKVSNPHGSVIGEQKSWIDSILNDPIAGKERLANSIPDFIN